MENKKTKEFLQYQFSHDEIHLKGLELARLSSEAEAIENERKSVASEFKAKLDSIASQMHELGRHINNGYEHRYIECTVKYHDPNTGIKSTYRNDNGELVKKETMTGAEMQEEIDFEALPEEPEKDTLEEFQYEPGEVAGEAPEPSPEKQEILDETAAVREAKPRRGRPPRQE